MKANESLDTSVFPADQEYMILDFETYSEADLRDVGAYEYSMHPSTEVLCAAWVRGTKKDLETRRAKSWNPNQPTPDFGEFIQGLLDPKVILVAHNAFFDRMITRNVFAVKDMYSKRHEIRGAPIERWLCTASLSAALGLPRSLEDSVNALNLPMKKNKDGKKLIQKFSKPRKPSKANPSKRNTFQTDPDDFARFVEYCRDDVDATIGLLLNLEMLSPFERRVWCLDQKMNERGFAVDRPLVSKVLNLIDVETQMLHQEVQELSFGVIESANQRGEVLQFLKDEGVFLPDLQKDTVASALKDGLAEGVAKRMLEIRAAISKTSTAKYEAFELRSRTDGRIRDSLVYHKAVTGRWGGAGLQPQNLPGRGSIENTMLATEVLTSCDIETIRLIYGDPMEVFSSCIRNMIVATDGYIFDVVDYEQIEPRVLFWIAGDEPALKGFREKRDIYSEQASVVFNKPITKKENPYERFIGKQLILGCGYQMGPPRFVESCAAQGESISKDLATKAVAAYRSAHKPVVDLWAKLEKAALSAVQNPGMTFSVNRTKWFVQGDVLYCELPSGRRMAYQSPEVIFTTTQWDPRKPTLQYWSVHSQTRKWTKQTSYGGKLTENVVQAIARDIMVSAMIRVDRSAKWKLVLTVHDELVAERKISNGGSVQDLQRLMEVVPAWAEGCPIATEGWSSLRYKK